MQKRKYVLIAVGLGLAVILLVAAYSLVRQQIFLTQRHHLLCEVLKPGMTRDEVLNTLRQADDFVVSGGLSSSPSSELHVVFTDKRGRDLYGAFDLYFSDYKYRAAYVLGFDYIEGICDFSQPTAAITDMPTQIP